MKILYYFDPAHWSSTGIMKFFFLGSFSYLGVSGFGGASSQEAPALNCNKINEEAVKASITGNIPNYKSAIEGIECAAESVPFTLNCNQAKLNDKQCVLAVNCGKDFEILEKMQSAEEYNDFIVKTPLIGLTGEEKTRVAKSVEDLQNGLSFKPKQRSMEL